MDLLRRPLVVALAVIAVLLGARNARADDREVWYVVEMAGKRAGWMRTAETNDAAAGTITISSEMRLQIRRGSAAPMTITMSTESVETTDGKPVSMKRVQSLGSPATTTQWTFGPENITVITTPASGKPTTTTVALPDGVWLMPAAAEQYVQKRLGAGATQIEVRRIDPENGPQPYTATMKVLERTTVEALGKSVPAIKVSQSVSVMSGMESTAYIDERGTPIRTTTDFGALSMTILAADKDLAMAELNPPELMERTLVTPDRPIEGARTLKRAVYVLSLSEGTMPDLPSTGHQRVEAIDGRSARVTVDLTAPASPAPAADTSDETLRKASEMLDSADATVRELVEKAVKDAKPGAPARAEAMRRFVGRYIKKKNLDVGFASATDVARTREGDCSEHACLLAAMLRADGIPARIASGLLYVDDSAGAKGIFGYHMWAQALLEVDGTPTWVDLDATLPGSMATDATHIAVLTSALADNETQNPMVKLVPLLGRLEIKVESTGSK